MKKRALISVYDKTGILDFAKFLVSKGIEIISTGGTYKYLKENNIEVIEVSKITNFEEMLDGRVKTLHPNIHGGILALRDNEEHMRTLKERNIDTIDYVIVNLYPFFEKVKEDLSFEEKIDFDDLKSLEILASETQTKVHPSLSSLINKGQKPRRVITVDEMKTAIEGILIS